jgi:hypothetical protein
MGRSGKIGGLGESRYVSAGRPIFREGTETETGEAS